MMDTISLFQIAIIMTISSFIQAYSFELFNRIHTRIEAGHNPGINPEIISLPKIWESAVILKFIILCIPFWLYLAPASRLVNLLFYLSFGTFFGFYSFASLGKPTPSQQSSFILYAAWYYVNKFKAALIFIVIYGISWLLTRVEIINDFIIQTIRFFLNDWQLSPFESKWLIPILFTFLFFFLIKGFLVATKGVQFMILIWVSGWFYFITVLFVINEYIIPTGAVEPISIVYKSVIVGITAPMVISFTVKKIENSIKRA